MVGALGACRLISQFRPRRDMKSGWLTLDRRTLGDLSPLTRVMATGLWWLTFGNNENKQTRDRSGYFRPLRTLLMVNRLATVAPTSGFLGCRRASRSSLIVDFVDCRAPLVGHRSLCAIALPAGKQDVSYHVVLVLPVHVGLGSEDNWTAKSVTPTDIGLCQPRICPCCR